MPIVCHVLLRDALHSVKFLSIMKLSAQFVAFSGGFILTGGAMN
jgi:hypothetical protein